ncbi:MAG TPA: DUF3137 domain-containing protein, partial [Ferruginibacter sp.]|nr:DUF3137 domain-containing protein [Ferruginibacter sp.]
LTAGWLIALFIAGAVFSVYKYAQENDKFTDAYKAAVIKAIMDEICPGLTYEPDERVPSKEYRSSSLYRIKYDYYDGNDLIRGSIDGVKFHCSDLHVQCDFRPYNQRTIFRGLFFAVKINPQFSGGTYVKPRGSTSFDYAEMEQWLDKYPMPRVTPIQFSDDDFTQCFRVSSTWPSQAAEILTDMMRHQMIELRTKLDTAIAFSFVAGKCYIAIPLKQDMLEPTKYDPGDEEEIKKYFVTLQVIPRIIRALPFGGLQ